MWHECSTQSTWLWHTAVSAARCQQGLFAKRWRYARLGGDREGYSKLVFTEEAG